MIKCALRIREAKVEDIKYVFDVEVKSFKYPYSMITFLTLLNLFPNYFLISEYCGKVVGYVTAVIDRDGYGHIMSIAVDPEFRGLGIGRALMEAVESKLRYDGIKGVRLEVAVNNSIAIKLYERLGYKLVKVLHNYYPDGEDAYLMAKDLSY